MMKKIWCLLLLLLSLVCMSSFCSAGYVSSDWAKSELSRAETLSLIPDSLLGADLTQDITRAEFAAVSVKAYEAITQSVVPSASENPFVDTADSDVLKAHTLGIFRGVSATEFSPDSYLSREQAATILHRVLGLSFAGEAESDDFFVVENPTQFADDALISDWAKNGVYFLAEYGIIHGIGENKFAPRNTTPAEEAVGYANTTREQAILLYVRLIESIAAVTPQVKTAADAYKSFIPRLENFLIRLSQADNPDDFQDEYIIIMEEMQIKNEQIEKITDEAQTLGDILYIFDVLLEMIKVIEGFSHI